MIRLRKVAQVSALGALVLAAFARADEKPSAWRSLFDGKSLGGWSRTSFAAGSEARVELNFRGQGPAIVVEYGDTLSGITWTGGPAKNPPDNKPVAEKFELPRSNYELSLEFMKIEGNDFACGLTFPAGDSHVSLILGGWGGATVGISSIDEKDASQNETTRFETFKKDRWYRVRLRVTPVKIESWLDDRKIVDVKIEGRKLSLRSGEINKSTPLGIATFRTSAAYRNIKLRTLPNNSR